MLSNLQKHHKIELKSDLIYCSPVLGHAKYCVYYITVLMRLFTLQEYIYTYSVVVICQELLIHWTNDLFYYTGLHLLLINKINHHNSKQDLSSKPASRSTTFEFE